MTPSTQLEALRQAWEHGDISFPRLVLELEVLVAGARTDLSETAGRAAFRAWGQLEIINALTLDSGTAMSADDLQEVAAELERLRGALSQGVGE